MVILEDICYFFFFLAAWSLKPHLCWSNPPPDEWGRRQNPFPREGAGQQAERPRVSLVSPGAGVGVWLRFSQSDTPPQTLNCC